MVEGSLVGRERLVSKKKTTAGASNAEGRWEGDAFSLKSRGRQGRGMLKEAGRPRTEKATKGSGSLSPREEDGGESLIRSK